MRGKWMLVCGAWPLLLAGCSYQTMLDKLASPERQAELAALANSICTAPDTVVPQMHPDLQASLIAAKPLLPNECPKGPAKWQVVNYEWAVNVDNGARRATEDVALVSPSGNRWSTVKLRFLQLDKSPKLIMSWNVLASDTKPPALVMAEEWDSNVGTLRIVAGLIIAAIAGLFVWLVRRYRQRKQTL